jgi:hypothetical protein
MTLNFTSVLSCDIQQEEKQSNSLNKLSEILPIGSKKREKKSESFPFGKW